MKSLASTIFFLLILTSAAFSQGQRLGRPVVMGPPPTANKAELISNSDPLNDYAQKGLPAARTFGGQRGDKMAAEIAKKISDYNDPNALAYLIGALQNAGFYIIDPNGKILYKPSWNKGMGLTFYDFEVAGMLKFAKAGSITSLDSLTKSIGSKLPPGTDLSGAMLQDLRIAANLKDDDGAGGAKRFFARLMIELGKNLPKPVDLMTASADQVPLSMFQMEMWRKRLIGDFIAIAKAKGATARDIYLAPRRNATMFLNAAYTNDGPCGGAAEGIESTEYDGAANAETTISGKIMEVLGEEIGGKFGAAAERLGAISTVLTFLKLAATLAQVKGSMDIDQPLPLERTKSHYADGEQKKLTAKFELKGDFRQLNCFRPALNAIGLDFNVPTPGPLTEKPIEWSLKTVESERFVQFRSPDGGTFDFTKLETDSNGESKIMLEGVKQKGILVDKVVPVTKTASVTAKIALKNPKDSKQEVIDVLGGATGVLTGGPLGIINVIPEIMNRMKIEGYTLKVPVRDWEPCSDDWGGTVNYTKDLSHTVYVNNGRAPNGNSNGKGQHSIYIHEEVSVTLNPRSPDEVKAKAPQHPADYDVHGTIMERFNGDREGDPCCGKESGQFDTHFVKGREVDFDDAFRQAFSISYSGGESDFQLGFGFQIGKIKSRVHSYQQISGTSCPLEKETAYDKDSDGTESLQDHLAPGHYPKKYNAGDTEFLEGNKTFQDIDGSTINWSWSLSRCKQSQK